MRKKSLPTIGNTVINFSDCREKIRQKVSDDRQYNFSTLPTLEKVRVNNLPTISNTPFNLSTVKKLPTISNTAWNFADYRKKKKFSTADSTAFDFADCRKKNIFTDNRPCSFYFCRQLFKKNFFLIFFSLIIPRSWVAETFINVCIFGQRKHFLFGISCRERREKDNAVLRWNAGLAWVSSRRSRIFETP